MGSKIKGVMIIAKIPLRKKNYDSLFYIGGEQTHSVMIKVNIFSIPKAVAINSLI